MVGDKGHRSAPPQEMGRMQASAFLFLLRRTIDYDILLNAKSLSKVRDINTNQ